MVYWGYNPLTNLLLTSWDIRVDSSSFYNLESIDFVKMMDVWIWPWYLKVCVQQERTRSNLSSPFLQAFLAKYTLPETNSLLLKIDGWNTNFFFGCHLFRCELLVSGRVSILHVPSTSTSRKPLWPPEIHPKTNICLVRFYLSKLLQLSSMNQP